MSPAFLLPKVASAAPYFRKLPAIQWYPPEPVRFSTASPKSRRCSLAPPSPEEPTSEGGESRLEGQRDERRLAVARHAFDADFLRVHGAVRFEIIQSARGA